MAQFSATTKDILWVYWAQARKYRLILVTILVTSIGIALVNKIAAPWYVKQLVDGLSLQQPLDMLVQIVFMLSALWIVGVLANVLKGYVSVYFQARIMTNLQQKAFQHLLYHSFRFFSNSFAGALTRRVNRLGRSFEDVAELATYDIFPFFIEILGVQLVVFWRSPVIAGMMLVWILVFLGFNYWFAQWKLPIDAEKSERDSEVTSVLADAISNTTTIQLFSGQKDEIKRFNKIVEKFFVACRRAWNLNEISSGIQGSLIVLIQCGVMYYALLLWKEGRLTVGDFVLFQGYLAVLADRLWGFYRVIRRLYESLADAKEMVDIMNTPHEITDVQGAKQLKVTEGKIEFKDVLFGYEGPHIMLNRLNLTIAPREKVALVGPSGAGKSTLTKLLFRLYDLNQGSIVIDGQSIKDVTQDSLHDAIAFVPQEPILFHRSLLENIRYGRHGAKDAEVIKAAKQANCHTFIESLPQRYHTLVGERGVKLSGGERQRVAIARAILKDAPILVLDEATSSLDSESESLIQDALRGLMTDKTVIVIAHRLSTILGMDRIIVMQDGHVVSMGSHRELIHQPGIYQTLWNIQAGGFLR